MAQDITSKQLNFAARWRDVVTSTLTAFAALEALSEEWTANAYATGANPGDNNITDAVLQNNGFAYLTALQLNQSLGAVASLKSTFDSNRGYLEAIRP